MIKRRLSWNSGAGGAALVVAVLLCTSSVRAATVTFEFSGVITNVYEPGNEFGGSVHVNDPFVVKYTFDTLTPDLLPGYPTEGYYQGSTASLILPGLQYDTTALLNVYTGPPLPDMMFSTAQEGRYQFFASFDDVAISNDHLPIDWVHSVGRLNVKVLGAPGTLTGTITPEPATLSLLLLGLFCFKQR
jgi:hypothetical protein